MKELLVDAVYKRAGSIILDFTREAVAVRYQIDGVWHTMPSIDRETGDGILATLKVLANLNAEERRAKQQGGFKFKDPQHKIDLQLTSQGVKTGERVLVKLFEAQKNMSISELGMLPDVATKLREHLNSSGYVLVACKPGDGLTTAWNSVLSASDKVIRDYVGFSEKNHSDTTAENIEFTVYDKAAGEDPAIILRTLTLKQPEAYVLPDPIDGNIINMMCDEISSEERYAISVLPAASAAEAIVRFLAYKPDRSKFAKASSAVLYHRLVRRLCDYCKQPYQPQPQLLKKLGIPAGQVQHLYKNFQPLPDQQEEMETCRACAGLGYIGRIAIFELLEINDEIRQAIVNNPTVEAITAAAKASGHSNLQHEGIKLVAAGVTSINELQRVLK